MVTTFVAPVPPPLQAYVPPPVAVSVTLVFVHVNGPSLVIVIIGNGSTIILAIEKSEGQGLEPIVYLKVEEVVPGEGVKILLFKVPPVPVSLVH